MMDDASIAGDSLVSVVIPFLDAGRFIAEAIESVLAQSYPHWEMLLVDDGSTDEGSRVARDYAARIPARIRCLEHPGHENRGVNASRNLGIRHARGTFVAVLDADDVWTPHKLEEQVATFDAAPQAAFVYGTRELWTSWQSDADAVADVRVDHGIAADRMYPPPLLFLALYGERRATPPCGSDPMFRRDAALRVGGYPEGFRRIFEDQAFLVKLCLQEPVFVSSRCWTRYRQHAGSVMAKWMTEPDEDEWKRFVEWMNGYVRSQPDVGFAVRRASRRALFEVRPPRLARALRRIWRRSRREVGVTGSV